MTVSPGEPAPASPPETESVLSPRRSARQLQVGVIVWSDDPEVEPTVIAEPHPVTLALVMAVTIHEMLDESPAYEGAADFLAEHPPPQDWRTPEDVDDWLEALREATPYPAYSFHQVPVTGGADGTNHTVVSRTLRGVLRDREQELTGETPDRPRPEPPTRSGLGR